MQGMLRWSLVLAGVLLLAKGSLAGEKENPLKKAKVGDWVSYSMTNDMRGMKTSSAIKQTVKAKDEKELTLLIEMDTAGQKYSQEAKIPLDKPYDPTAGVAKMPQAKMETLGEGDETITVGGKQYACHWVQIRATMESGTVSTSKVWNCPDVPLGGTVKMERAMDITTGGTTMKTTSTMELTGSGSQ
jgi:hypothetical protein